MTALPFQRVTKVPSQQQSISSSSDLQQQDHTSPLKRPAIRPIIIHPPPQHPIHPPLHPQHIPSSPHRNPLIPLLLGQETQIGKVLDHAAGAEIAPHGRDGVRGARQIRALLAQVHAQQHEDHDAEDGQRDEDGDTEGYVELARIVRDSRQGDDEHLGDDGHERHEGDEEVAAREGDEDGRDGGAGTLDEDAALGWAGPLC